MRTMLWTLGVSLLMQGCLGSLEERTGCMKWTPSGSNVCCEACYPGHRLVYACGPRPKDLCTPCEPGTYTEKPKQQKCLRCRQCLDSQVLVEECTATANTKCGCRDGLICGDGSCSFCVDKCTKGQEPTSDRSCRPCPDGTFNDKGHQKCKPWSTKCPNPDQEIVAKGDAFSDIKCANVSVNPLKKPEQPGHTEQAWPLVTFVAIIVVLTAFCAFVITMAVRIVQKKQKKPEKPTPKPPIIRTPTDDPRTLIAIECSFHEAQQEQGSSSESLDSKDSSEQLIGRVA